jgi:hypothetical protein
VENFCLQSKAHKSISFFAFGFSIEIARTLQPASCGKQQIKAPKKHLLCLEAKPWHTA